MTKKVGLALAAWVCLYGSCVGTAPAASKRTTVVVMRHCARSTGDDGIPAKPGFGSYNDYSAKPWPAFPVPPLFCLPRGETIVQGQGRWWRENVKLDLPFRAVADIMPNDAGQRDNATMHSFLKGLDLDSSSLSVSMDHSPFVPTLNPACLKARPSTDAMLEGSAQHIKENPPPPEYYRQLEELYRILGDGAAGNWTNIPCKPKMIPYIGGIPMPEGACAAASMLAERLEMEWGGGMEVGWARVPAPKQQIPEFLLVHTWHYLNTFAPAVVHRWGAASIMRKIRSIIDANAGGTTLYVGHDADLMMLKGALGLTWMPEPYPSNATLPGSQLVFVREGDQVSASYVYVPDYGSKLGLMKSVDAVFSSSSSAHIDNSGFTKLLRENSIEECANTDSLSDVYV